MNDHCKVPRYCSSTLCPPKCSLSTLSMHVFLEANEQIDIEDEDHPMGLGLYEKSFRETCFKKRLDERNLCPEGNLFLVPMCDTCNKTQETANFRFELKPGTILVETCVRENYAKKKPRLVVYLCPSKDGARLWRPDCCLNNKNPRSSAKKTFWPHTQNQPLELPPGREKMESSFLVHGL